MPYFGSNMTRNLLNGKFVNVAFPSHTYQTNGMEIKWARCFAAVQVM